jgi:hypothetical protein
MFVFPSFPSAYFRYCSVIAALSEVEDTLNGVFEHAFSGFTYGDECGDKCIDWSITYAQVSTRCAFLVGRW